MCIEEPELHIHPILQRKLLNYISEQTTNQYFLSTHSASILTTDQAYVGHVRLDNGISKVNRALSAHDRCEVCVDLGFRASDLLQANSVVWVEGPSDRIYLKHWLHSIAPELLEGIHFSIMFYGGRLLSHLSADDPDVEDFISLRRLNRFITIIMDSDRSSARQRLNDTKKRVQSEFDRGLGFAWVTAGREIENYIPRALMLSALNDLYGPGVRLLGSNRYHRAHACQVAGKVLDTDKVRIAHAVTSRTADLSVMDLGKKIKTLVTFIESANRLS